MKKLYKYIILAALLSFLAYNSFYFKKLSEVKNQKSNTFDFESFADSLFYKGILKREHTLEISRLLLELKSNTDSTFKAYGNRLGIGNSAYFMIKGEGKVIEKTDDGLKLVGKNGIILHVDTKYIFGNAIRDASGLVKLTDFKTNADFNQLSETLNTIIREKAIPKDLKKFSIGDNIRVIGAIKLSKKGELGLNILPVKIIVID